MNKKIILPFLLAPLGLVLTSCVDNNGGKDPSLNESYISFSEQKDYDYELTLEVLTDATYSFDFGVNGDIRWSSDNETVATVDNGFIIGKSAGEAYITCECGIEKKVIKVTVVNHGYVPNVDFGLIEEVINLNVNSSFKLNPNLVYINKVYDDVTYQYSTSNETIVTIDANGSIKAKSKGEATITAVAQWRGFDSRLLTFKIPVAVN